MRGTRPRWRAQTKQLGVKSEFKSESEYSTTGEDALGPKITVTRETEKQDYHIGEGTNSST